jgi:hypothetical protein
MAYFLKKLFSWEEINNSYIRLRKAALSVTALAAEEETQPEAVVHPRRRRIRQDER